jgi:hypothetical protein
VHGCLPDLELRVSTATSPHELCPSSGGRRGEVEGVARRGGIGHLGPSSAARRIHIGGPRLWEIW